MTLLTTDEFREFEETDMEDSALQVLLDAAEAEINRFAGETGEVTEWFAGGQRFIHLARPASSITSITETNSWESATTTLGATDYLLYPGGFRLQRIGSGANPRWGWDGRVVVTYTTDEDPALRKSVQADLVKLELNTRFGLSQQTIGTWSESYQQSAGSAAVQHELILSRLKYAPSMVVV